MHLKVELLWKILCNRQHNITSAESAMVISEHIVIFVSDQLCFDLEKLSLCHRPYEHIMYMP